VDATYFGVDRSVDEPCGLIPFAQKKGARLELRSCSRRRDSLRVLLLVAAAWLAICVATRAEVTYTITSYLAGLADLPRDAFKKNPGSWTQVAILIAGGALIVGLHLKDTKDVGRQRSSDTMT